MNLRELRCIACGGSSSQLFERFGIPIRACHHCELRFAEFQIAADHCDKFYSDDYFVGGEDGYPDYLATRESMMHRGQRYVDIVSQHAASPGRVLDVGAAAGYLLRAFVDSGWYGEGLEPNEKMAQIGRSELGLTMHSCSLEQFATLDGTFDLVTLFQVFSHLANPRAALGRIADITKSGGFCLVETWDYNSLSARLVGRSWHQYSPPRVIYWFTRKLVHRWFADAGYELVSSGRAPKEITGTHAKALAAHANGSFLGGVVKTAANLIPDNATVPYPGNDCFWALYRKM